MNKTLGWALASFSIVMFFAPIFSNIILLLSLTAIFFILTVWATAKLFKSGSYNVALFSSICLLIAGVYVLISSLFGGSYILYHAGYYFIAYLRGWYIVMSFTGIITAIQLIRNPMFAERPSLSLSAKALKVILFAIVLPPLAYYVAFIVAPLISFIYFK